METKLRMKQMKEAEKDFMLDLKSFHSEIGY